MITLYFSEGLDDSAITMMTMLATNTFIQIIIVFAFYQKKSWKRIMKELIITVLFLRPFVDCFRVKANVKDDTKVLDAVEEMMVNKGIELATETIPGCVLQCYVMLMNPSLGGSGGAIASILVSALTTGLTSTMLSIDFDTDPRRRIVQPLFYGYVKDKRRGLTFALMTLTSTLHNLSRSLGYAILAVEDVSLALRFFLVEVSERYVQVTFFTKLTFVWLARRRLERTCCSRS